jgi:TonB family protein
LNDYSAVLVTTAHDFYVAFAFTALSEEELGSLWDVTESIRGWSAKKPPLRAPIQGVMRQGRAFSQPPPKYPSEAKEKGITGTVVLRALIGTKGRIKNLDVISGPPELREAAMKAVRKWRYEPYKIGDTPVEVETQITVNFNLNR